MENLWAAIVWDEVGKAINRWLIWGASAIMLIGKKLRNDL